MSHNAKTAWLHSESACVTAPHDCNVPKCPGPRNRAKLAAYDALLVALRDTSRVLRSQRLPSGPYRTHTEGHSRSIERAQAAIVAAEKATQ